MKIAGYQTHPAADLFPLMEGQPFKELVKDIEKNGLLQPVILHEGKILDGRNRARACEELDLEFKIKEWDGKGDSPTAWVLSTNLQRRHLTQSQKAIIAADALPLFEKEAKARQRDSATVTNTKRAGKKETGSAPVREPSKKTRGAGKAAKAAAAASGVGSRYVEAVKALKKSAPHLVEKVRSGEMTLKQAEKQVRKKAQLKAVKEYQPPEGKFQVIVADPPWAYEDELDGSDTARGGLPYPAMTLQQIAQVGVADHADDDCILWLWVTNAHLIDGSATSVLDAWGFEPKTMLTWDKVNMGAGRWLRGQTEHCIVAVKGKPIVDLSNQTTLISEKRREHSRKPEAFYKLVEELCPGTARLELFAREDREGWTAAGVENLDAA